MPRQPIKTSKKRTKIKGYDIIIPEKTLKLQIVIPKKSFTVDILIKFIFLSSKNLSVSDHEDMTFEYLLRIINIPSYEIISQNNPELFTRD